MSDRREYDPFAPFDVEQPLSPPPAAPDDAPSSVGGTGSTPNETPGSLGTSDDGLEDLTRAQLVARAKELDLPHSGSKAELIERIRAR